MTKSTIGVHPVLSLDGIEQAALAAALLSLRIERLESRPTSLQASFTNWGQTGDEIGFLWFELLSIGKSISVGIDRSEPMLFSGRIAAVGSTYPEGAPPTIELVAEDTLADLRGSARSRIFESMSDADVIRLLAEEAGLSADVTLPGPVHSTVAQIDETNLALAQRCAADCAGLIWSEGDSLVARTAGSELVNLSYGGSLGSFQVLADTRTQVTSLSVTGWDRATKRAIREAGTLQEAGALSGPGLTARYFGSRIDHIVDRAPVSAAEARMWADAEVNASARRFIRGSGVTRQALPLRPGDAVELSNVGTPFDGRYRITRERHTFDNAHGFRTELEVERAALGGKS